MAFFLGGTCHGTHFVIGLVCRIGGTSRKRTEAPAIWGRLARFQTGQKRSATCPVCRPWDAVGHCDYEQLAPVLEKYSVVPWTYCNERTYILSHDIFERCGVLWLVFFWFVGWFGWSVTVWTCLVRCLILYAATIADTHRRVLLLAAIRLTRLSAKALGSNKCCQWVSAFHGMYSIHRLSCVVYHHQVKESLSRDVHWFSGSVQFILRFCHQFSSPLNGTAKPWLPVATQESQVVELQRQLAEELSQRQAWNVMNRCESRCVLNFMNYTFHIFSTHTYTHTHTHIYIYTHSCTSI